MPFKAYITEIRDIHQTGAGVPETSYYPALSNLLNTLGKALKPRVRAILNLRDQGADFPDGGLFTPDQFQRASSGEPEEGQLPSRGAIEVKSPKEDVVDVAQDEQVAKYLKTYGQVLATNLRDFVIVTRAQEGTPVLGERYTLADSDGTFWEAINHPRKMAAEHAAPFSEYLQRAMLHNAPLVSPEAVAWFLASYARDARSRIEDADLPALSHLRAALEQALGLTFEGEKGDHFFRSTLIQTLFYGVFSAWVLWSKQQPAGASSSFDWHSAGWYLRVPMIRALFNQIATPDKLEPLGLAELMDWTGNALNRVERCKFFSCFEEEHAVQYFYEPFLEAFDPQLRKELGVWYTPPEIVKYMVERVDTVLREELDILDGLADDRVYVLDPCCGTGAYLVQVIRRIAQTLSEKREGDALLAHTVKQAVTSRIFGFEILPAPFVVSHLQIGLLMQNMGAPLTEDAGERAGVYLTNALTGWEPPTEPKSQIPFPGMDEEREASDEVKREKDILVILGNPPYNAFAGVSPQEEGGLVDCYKEGLRDEWGIGKYNLDDLYVRFFRLAERRIGEMTGRGVVAFISNHSWVADASFVVLRKRLLATFDRFWIENLHGNRKASEYGPDGKTSQTIFAIPGFSPGIQQGVVTSLWVKDGSDTHETVRYRDDINASPASERRRQLLASLASADLDAAYELVCPGPHNRYSFRPCALSERYLDWPYVTDLCSLSPSNGLMEKRGGALVDTHRDQLYARMVEYYDRSTDWETFSSTGHKLAVPRASYDPRATRSRAQAGAFDPARIARYLIRPFDLQWCYYTGVPSVWNRPRPELWRQYRCGNAFLLTRFTASKDPEGPPFCFTRALCDDHCLSPDAIAVPHYEPLNEPASDTAQNAMCLTDSGPAQRQPALSEAAQRYLSALGVGDLSTSPPAAALPWMHVLAVGYSPVYLDENSDGIRQDYPRIPLPAAKEALETSAALGEQVAALLDVEKPVPTVTEGTIRPELAAIGSVSHADGEALDPAAGDLRVSAGWGYLRKTGATMPGQGRLAERAYTPEELDGIRKGSAERDMSLHQALELLGERTCDVYLNDVAYWRNIPLAVWEYTIGGYQVIKKWLSYREHKVLGRDLKAEEARYVTEMARRIAAIILLHPQLNANYERVTGDTYDWPNG